MMRFSLVSSCLDLRVWFVVCKLFTCCRSARRVSFLWLVGCVLVWWWFENSRACLYYFFIVNDCQYASSLMVFVLLGSLGGVELG
ncbi:hypothetical protein, partial [Bifidobacterium sp. SO4]|uniref:hypothetical protein n=1 Tax=Bifidobacterium sp. SO4 TaxID=2809030 RepID=UPI001BDC746F